MSIARFLVTGLLVALAVTGFSSITSKANAQRSVIESAKTEGVVGEQADGYLGIRGAVDASLRRKVGEINAKRRAVYEELAMDSSTTAAQVARVTGEMQIKSASQGEFYADEDGNWVQKCR